MLSQLFKLHGYSTAWVLESWHLGHDKKHVPKARGFDHTYGFLGHSSLFTPKQSTHRIMLHISRIKFSAHHQWETKRDGFACHPRETDKEIIEEEYLTWAIRDRGIKWMSEHKEEPFFLFFILQCPAMYHSRRPVDYYCEWETDLLGQTNSTKITRYIMP